MLVHRWFVRSPLTSAVTIQDSHFRVWDNWADVHSNFGRIAQFPRVLTPEFYWNRVEITWYSPTLGCVLFFVFFGFGQDAMTEYRHVYAWIRVNIFRRSPRPSNDSVLPTFRYVVSLCCCVWEATLIEYIQCPTKGSASEARRV